MLIIVIILGCSIGSFLGAVAYRLPRSVSWVKGRSKCDSCGHVLVWYDLIPVISWIVLLGRCRYCKANVGLESLLIELYMGAIFGLCYAFLARFGIPYVAFSMFLASCFILLALIDFHHYILPDSILILMVIIGLVYLYFFGTPLSENLRMTMFHTAQYGLYPHLGFWLLGEAVGVVVILGALWVATRGRAFGLGDAKYLGVLTILFGFPANIVVLCSASVVGGLVSAALLAGGKATMKTRLPFGVFLSSTATAFLFLGFWFFAHFSYLFVL